MTKEEFDHIFRSYRAALCVFANGLVHDEHIAKDLVSDVFLDQLKRGTKKVVVADYRSYLYRAVRNRCYTYLKQIKSRDFVDGVPDEIADEANLEQLYSELSRQLRFALSQLPEQCSKVVQMSYLENLPTSEIARQLGITESTVYNHKARGLALLKKMLSRRAFQSFISLFSCLILW